MLIGQGAGDEELDASTEAALVAVQPLTFVASFHCLLQAGHALLDTTFVFLKVYTKCVPQNLHTHMSDIESLCKVPGTIFVGTSPCRLTYSNYIADAHTRR